MAYSGCTSQALKFELNEGNNAQGSYRGMRSSGGSILNYQLYRNSSYNSLIGTGSSGVSFTAPSSGTGTVTVYGRIPANQSVTPGAYSDTIGGHPDVLIDSARPKETEPTEPARSDPLSEQRVRPDLSKPRTASGGLDHSISDWRTFRLDVSRSIW